LLGAAGSEQSAGRSIRKVTLPLTKEIPEMSDKYLWLVYVGLAGLSWGVYVPTIFFGGGELSVKGLPPASARLMSILCVGVAYFVIGVLFPLAMFLSGKFPPPTPLKATGLIFSGLAGVAGAVGAICVIFASQSAAKAAVDAGHAPETYRIYIAPLIFGLAPVITTIVSTLWHPRVSWYHFEAKMPHPLLWAGIILVGVGAALVLYSKELGETAQAKSPAPAHVGQIAETGQPAPDANP
jgi:hypothetical protein